MHTMTFFVFYIYKSKRLLQVIFLFINKICGREILQIKIMKNKKSCHNNDVDVVKTTQKLEKDVKLFYYHANSIAGEILKVPFVSSLFYKLFINIIKKFDKDISLSSCQKASREIRHIFLPLSRFILYSNVTKNL